MIHDSLKSLFTTYAPHLAWCIDLSPLSTSQRKLILQLQCCFWTFGFVWTCWVNIPNETAIFQNGIMISKTIGFNGYTTFSDTPISELVSLLGSSGRFTGKFHSDDPEICGSSNMSYVQMMSRLMALCLTSCWRTAVNEAQSNSHGWLVARDDARGGVASMCRLPSLLLSMLSIGFERFWEISGFCWFPFETFDVEALKGGEHSWHCFAAKSEALHHVVIFWRFPKSGLPLNHPF